MTNNIEKENQTHVFCVKGMHCPSCVVFIEDELRNAEGVREVSASLKERTVRVIGNFPDGEAALAEILTKYVASGGYAISLERAEGTDWKEFAYALPIAMLLASVFWLLQKAGIVNVLGGEELTFGTAALVGIVASLSTCLAVVGGVALSLSAGYAKGGRTLRPQISFHTGRFAGFFVLGGVLGLLGGWLPFQGKGSIVLTLLASFAMLVVALNLLEVFRFSIRMPAFLSKGILKSESAHAWGPFLLGVLTFFLPCGFTQSMQIYAIAGGEFLSGGLIMLFFALGTFPVLALLSFGGWSVEGKSWKGIFFKTAGLVLLMLSAFNIWSALAAEGILPPLGL